MNHEISHEKKIGPTKYPWEKRFYSRNIQGREFQTHELSRKNFGLTKYPKEKNFGPTKHPRRLNGTLEDNDHNEDVTVICWSNLCKEMYVGHISQYLSKLIFKFLQLLHSKFWWKVTGKKKRMNRRGSYGVKTSVKCMLFDEKRQQ